MQNKNHIKVSSFFIENIITSGDVEIKHCPKKQILADNFMKPLEGGLFRKLRAKLVNIPEDDDLAGIVWDGIKAPKGLLWKLHAETHTACPQ